MKSIFRLVLWPTLAGILIAIGILKFFPEQLALIGSDEAGITLPSTENTVLARNSGPVSYALAVNKAAPAVVNIYTTKIVERKTHPFFDDPFFRRFFGRGNVPKRQRMQSSLGSGVIVHEEGYVITNNHVVASADEIVVALQDGREGFAKIVGTDPETDIAVLKIEMEQLPTITLTTSESIAIGDVVLAIGNPFGVGQTVTMGIISATGRNQLGLTTFEDFIQTDAAINPGNSGGALVNAYGDLIGINTAIFSKSGGSQGIGFAIPSDLAKQIMLEIVQHGSVIRGWLGIEVQQLTPALASSFGLEKNTGVLVAGIHRNGPAHQAGLQPGDVLLQVDNRPVLNGREVMNQITQTKPGSLIQIEVLREGQIKALQATIAQRQANAD